jgi:hypothetical protein
MKKNELQQFPGTETGFIRILIKDCDEEKTIQLTFDSELKN